MSIIIKRPELEEFLRKNGRRLLYGRRKTGKTFYTRYVLRNYQYFIVRKGGSIYDPVNDEEFDTKTFLRICRKEDNIILDEFHRADSKLFDALHAGEFCENLVFITSTMHYYREFTSGPEAPLKGLFSIRRVGLISPVDLLRYEWGEVDKEFFELLVFYQEPALISRDLKDIVYSGREFAKSLVGEILDEEDYTFTRRYNAVLEAIAAGKNKLTEITNYLYSRGLLPKPSTSYITKYLEILVKTGLLEKIEIFGRKKSIYRHVSPLTELEYYLETRYGFGEVPLTWHYLKKILENILPLLVERFIERFLAELYGLKPVKILDPEIDIALLDYRRVRIVAEVKWVNRITRETVRKIESKLFRFEDAEKILIVPDKAIVPETSLSVWDIETLINKAKKR